MAKKTAKKKLTPDALRAALMTAALEQASITGWEKVDLATLSEKLKISVTDIEKITPNKNDLLKSILNATNKDASKTIKSDNDSVRDFLFELLMERFDILNQHRDAFLSIVKSLRVHPLQSLALAPVLYRSLSGILAAAGQGIDGPSGSARIIALAGIFLKNLHGWERDESADLAKLMAALDRDLERAERAAIFLKL